MQFVHRMLAYVVVIFVFIIWKKSKRIERTKLQTNGINLLLLFVGLQFLLGVLTIMLQVPVWLGVAHQVGAFLLLASFVFTLHRYTK